MITTDLLFDLLLILVAAWGMGSLFKRAGMPFIVGKLLGCGLGYLTFSRNRREVVVVGFRMNGRGAVEMVLAAVVLKLSGDLMAAGTISVPLLTNDQFSALILMAFVTTMIAPSTLRWSVMRACREDDQAAFCELWDGA
jgi:Kef-type K+ transport system membrane component KefB